MPAGYATCTGRARTAMPGLRNLLLGQFDRQLLAVNVRPHAQRNDRGSAEHLCRCRVPTPGTLLGANAYHDAGADQRRQLLWGPPGGDDFWSVSQATPVRDVILNGSLVFQSFCSETNYQSNNYGSGSYVANDEINGQLDWSGNQQGIAVNTDFQSAVGYVWNYVYSGDQCPPGYTPAAPATACSPTEDAFNDSYDIGSGTSRYGIYGVNQITELPQSPVSEQGPFLYTNSTGTSWDAFVPAVQDNTVGPNFISGPATGTSVPLSTSSSPTRARRSPKSRAPSITARTSS